MWPQTYVNPLNLLTKLCGSHVILGTRSPWKLPHTMSNALRPDLMTAPERLNEIAEILAVGLMRLLARQSSPLSPDLGESSLDCADRQSGHADQDPLEVKA